MSYLFTIVFWAVFGGVVLLLINLGDWAFPFIINWVGRLYRAMMETAPSRNSDALEEEVAAYLRDWRLFVVACAAKFAKIDGVVTKNELAVVEEVFATLELTGALRPLAIDTFRSAKKGPAMFQTCVRLYLERYQNELDLLQILVGVLFAIGYADGEPNVRTRQSLWDVCRLTGFDYQWWENNDKRRKARANVTPTNLDAAYKVLGCQPTDALNVVKDRYRKLVKEYHPDTVMSKDLAADFIQFAEERFKQIQAAYETVMEARSAKRT